MTSVIGVDLGGTKVAVARLRGSELGEGTGLGSGMPGW